MAPNTMTTPSPLRMTTPMCAPTARALRSSRPRMVYRALLILLTLLPITAWSAPPYRFRARRYNLAPRLPFRPSAIPMMASTTGADPARPVEQEEEALRNYLAGGTSAADAAKRFTSVVAQAENPEEAEDGLYRIWTLVNQAAEDRLEVQEKLIELLKAIKQLPDLTVGGSPITIRGQYVVWRDLPLLAEDIRTRWEYYDDGTNTPRRQEERRKYVNINAFAARICRHELDELKHMAIWTLRGALEDTPWNTPLPAAVAPPPGQALPNIRMLDGLVPGAAQWIFHAGRLVRASQEDYGSLAQGGDLFRGKQGFSPERWKFWKDRFRWVQAQEALQQETRAIAEKAARAMDQID